MTFQPELPSYCPVRADLHCQQQTPTQKPAKQSLNAINCPESFSPARPGLRRMASRGAWISSPSPTTTPSRACWNSPHDPDVIVGEELTC